jgi:hypothetical protein
MKGSENDRGKKKKTEGGENRGERADREEK